MNICLKYKYVILEDRRLDCDCLIWVDCDLSQRQHSQKRLLLPRSRTKFESADWHSDCRSERGCDVMHEHKVLSTFSNE
jgi:hypothetical protein